MTSSTRTRPSNGAIVAVFLLVLVLVLLAVAVARGVNLGKAANDVLGSMFPPPAATAEAREIRSLYDVVFFIAAAIFLVVEGLIIWSVVRYRRKPGDDVLPPQTHGNNVAEIAWTVIPTIIVAFLFYISWQTLNSVDAVSKNPDLHIRAVAGQFQWSFVYLADDDQTQEFTQFLPSGQGGGLVVPVGRKIQLELESPDVIHAFYVPRFLFKRDVVPGMVNKFDFTLDQAEAGQTFRGQCAELCGIGHRTMTFEVHAMSQADYDAWLKQQIATAQASPSPGGSAAPPSATLNLTAQNIKFSAATLDAPADKPFAIAFDNQDAGITHDVAIQDSTGALIFNGQDVKGPGKSTDNVQPLKAGTYTFICTFHPVQMTGQLTVK
ncbi:MAG: cytochrome c oxidase subunit II [Chloroflexi bacterium]|nr:MAG: cytochrome c oxidase subunit II [Chloroflexota bacterium]